MIVLRKGGLVAGVAALLVGSGCASLDVTNPNNPDIERAQATPEDVRNLAQSSVRSWYIASTDFEPFTAFMVTSDVMTANFGNFGMRFNNVEPRIPYDNLSTSGDAGVARQPWEQNYAALGAANDVLRVLGRGLVITNAAETEKARHLAMFTQAATLMNIALTFDRGFVPLEDYDPTDPAAARPTLQPFGTVATTVMQRWDALIAATAGKTHTYGPEVIPLTVGPLTSARLNKLANTMAAATLAYMPRNATGAAAVDWGKVLQYAENGISTGANAFDFTVIGDGNIWWSYIAFYGDDPTWMRVDTRLINRMDPTQPARFNGTIVPYGGGGDRRLTTDYKFENSVIGDPGRGIWMQSPWSHVRYFEHSQASPTAAEGPAPFLLRAENDLLIAEALIRTGGDRQRAVDLINRTRVDRGGLAPATAAQSNAELLSYIWYERDVELAVTNGWDLFRRRQIPDTDPAALQAGTFRHLPIPGRELETLGLPWYTFGGTSGPVMSSGPIDGPTFQYRSTAAPERLRRPTRR